MQPNPIFVKINVEKCRPKMRATSVIFKKLFRVNNDPCGENLPNHPVTDPS
jgi:hypothetical protein